jgi:hypothetical protein
MYKSILFFLICFIHYSTSIAPNANDNFINVLTFYDDPNCTRPLYPYGTFWNWECTIINSTLSTLTVFEPYMFTLYISKGTTCGDGEWYNDGDTNIQGFNAYTTDTCTATNSSKVYMSVSLPSYIQKGPYFVYQIINAGYRGIPCNSLTTQYQFTYDMVSVGGLCIGLLGLMLVGIIYASLVKKIIGKIISLRKKSHIIHNIVTHAKIKTTSELKCTLCKKALKDCILKPCIHMYCCNTCYITKNITNCSICNTKIESVEKIFNI